MARNNSVGLSLALLGLALASPEPVRGQPQERYLLLDRTAALVRTFNVADGMEMGSARAGASPDSVVVSPNGRLAFVANLNSFYVSVVDLTIGAEIARIRNLRARQLALNSSGTRLVATVVGQDQVAIVDTSDFSILQVVSLDGLGGDVAGAVDILPSAVVVVGNRAYLNPSIGNRPVFVVDINSYAVSTTVPIVGGSVAANNTIAATPDGNSVLAFRTGVGANRMAIIDTNSTTNAATIIDTIFPVSAVAVTRDAADPDGIYGFVVTAGNPNLRIQAIDLNSGSPTFGQFLAAAFLPFASPPGIVTAEIALTADSNTAYVVLDLTNASPNLAIVNTSTFGITARTIGAVRLTGVTTGFTQTVPPPTAPQVTGTTPSLVVNGNSNPVRILGANFLAGARVRIGSLNPADATVLSSGELEATVPAEAPAQGADIIVTNPGSSGPVNDQHLSGIRRSALVIASPPTFQPAHQVLAANFGEGTLAVLHISTNANVTPLVAAGHEPLSVAATPDGARAFTLSFNPPTTTAYDIVNSVVQASVPFGSPGTIAGQSRGIGAVVFPPTQDLGVYFVEGISVGPGVFNEQLVVLKGTAPFNRLLTLSAGLNNAANLSGGLAVSPNGRFAYHNGFIAGVSTAVDGRIIAFDTVAQAVNVRTTSGLGVSGFQPLPYVTPDGAWLLMSGAGAFGANSSLRVFDVANDPMLMGASVATIGGMPPPGVAAVLLGSPQVCGNRLYAFDYLRNVVYVFNFDPQTADFSQLATFVVPASPGLFAAEMVATPDASLLYLALREENAVAILDTAAILSGAPGALLTKVGVGLAPVGLAVRPGLATAPGTNVSVQPIREVTISFNNVLSGGETSVTTANTHPLPVPAGFQVGNPPVYYEISTTATFSGPIEVCFTYEQGQFQGPESKLRVLHEENGVFVDRTLSVDPGRNRICALVNGFSAFIVGEGSVEFLFESLLTGIAEATSQPGIRRSLQAKVIAARLAHQRGQVEVAVNQLNALKAEIMAQSGRHLTEDAAQMLLNQTETLIGAF